jgi:hypothetical protein
MKIFSYLCTMFLFAQIAQAAVEFEVQPLTIRTQEQVIGVDLGQNKAKAIIFTGEAAQQIAQSAGKRFYPNRQMIIMTGDEVDSFISPLAAVTYGTGKMAFLTGAGFAGLGLALGTGAILAGTGVAWVGTVIGFTIAKQVMYYTILGSLGTAYVGTAAGFELMKVPFYVLGGTLEFLCSIPGFFGLPHCGF